MKHLALIAFALISFIMMSCEDSNDHHLDEGAFYSDLDANYPSDPGFQYSEQYNEIAENEFILTSEEPTSTFSIDADGGAYANVRRFLNNDQLPPGGAVRTEELINYFDYDYDEVLNGHPIALNGEVSSCPWTTGNKLVRIGIRGKSIAPQELPPSNIVLLIDVSGSMGSDDKLELLKQGLNLFVDQLDVDDRVAIVTYAAKSGLALESTPGDQKNTIKEVINTLGTGGSTAGAEGILTAYEVAQESFIPDGNNRVIVGTDGDFNVGPSSQEELIELIESMRDQGIFLTTVGLGTGNYNDAALEQIANHGNGTYEYIDNLEQAKKVFIYEYSKFYTVAKDVKVQVDFNANVVHSYRLIGYENRVLENEDFEDDEKDAGEIGAGQAITALYEIVPASGGSSFQEPTFEIDFRYKNPDAETSIPISLEIEDNNQGFSFASESMRFSAAVASFGMLLRDSDYKGDTSFDKVSQWASGASQYDPHGFRQEFLSLIEKAESLQ